MASISEHLLCAKLHGNSILSPTLPPELSSPVGHDPKPDNQNRKQIQRRDRPWALEEVPWRRRHLERVLKGADLGCCLGVGQCSQPPTDMSSPIPTTPLKVITVILLHCAGSERSSHLPKVTQQGGGRARIHIPSLSSPGPQRIGLHDG